METISEQCKEAGKMLNWNSHQARAREKALNWEWTVLLCKPLAPDLRSESFCSLIIILSVMWVDATVDWSVGKPLQREPNGTSGTCCSNCFELLFHENRKLSSFAQSNKLQTVSQLSESFKFEVKHSWKLISRILFLTRSTRQARPALQIQQFFSAQTLWWLAI